MLNRIMAWIQSKRIIISSLVITIALAFSGLINGSVSENHVIGNHYANGSAGLILNNHGGLHITNILFIWLITWILLHICQWLFHLIRS